MAQKLKQGLCISLEGWGGREMGVRFKRRGIHVYLWLIHVEFWQKTTKFCKAIILQLKNYIYIYIYIYIKNKQNNYQYIIKDKFSTNILWTLLPYVSQVGTHKDCIVEYGPHLNDKDHLAWMKYNSFINRKKTTILSTWKQKWKNQQAICHLYRY